MRQAAELAGRELKEIMLTSSTDATEILGCFQQVKTVVNVVGVSGGGVCVCVSVCAWRISHNLGTCFTVAGCGSSCSAVTG